MKVLPPCTSCGTAMVGNDGHPAPAGMRRHNGHGICGACATRASKGQRAARMLGYLTPAYDSRPWVADALCAQADPEEWFPDQGESPRAAVAICRQCPARELCLQWALDNDEPFGIYGGVTAKARQRLKRRRAA